MSGRRLLGVGKNCRSLCGVGQGSPSMDFLSSFSFFCSSCTCCPFPSSPPSSPRPPIPCTLTTFNRKSYNPLSAIVTLTSSRYNVSSPCASVFKAKSSRLCSLTMDAEREALRSSVNDKSSRCVRKDDCERKKYRFSDRSRGISSSSLSRS